MIRAFLATICILTCIVSSVDNYCAWNRADKSDTQNNAETYNYINGEFTRWIGFYSGDLWHGQPYYRSQLTTCFVPNLYMYRYQDTTDFPPTYTWVIAGNMGQEPELGYAYCNIPSADQSRPDGACDGNWMIGQPRDDTGGTAAAHTADAYFKVMPGGCPQITCSALNFTDNKNDDWAGQFTYFQPNIYQQTGRSDTSESGEWYLFFNPKVWAWAVHEYITDYAVCEDYKLGKGFASVGNVIAGPALSSGFGKTDGEYVYYTPSTGTARVIICIGPPLPTPAPTAEQTWEPTKAPITIDYCGIQYGQISPLKVAEILAQCGCTQNMQDLGHCTPSPTYNVIVTLGPTGAPSAPTQSTSASSTTQSTSSSSTTASPASQPASPPTPTTAAPTSPGTARPTEPTTAAPTDQAGTARPTEPTTAAPTSQGTAKPTEADAGNRLNGNAFILAVVVAVVKLLF